MKLMLQWDRHPTPMKTWMPLDDAVCFQMLLKSVVQSPSSVMKLGASSDLIIGSQSFVKLLSPAAKEPGLTVPLMPQKRHPVTRGQALGSGKPGSPQF